MDAQSLLYSEGKLITKEIRMVTNLIRLLVFFYFLLICLIIHKVCPSGTELGVIDTAIFKFEAEVCVDC